MALVLKEQDLVRRWVKGLRDSDFPELAAPTFSSASIRNGPMRPANSPFPAMTAWSSGRAGRRRPSGEEAREQYLSSLYHADAVIGINTTAMIEAAFLGRPVFTILGTEFSESQTGTLHFAEA